MPQPVPNSRAEALRIGHRLYQPDKPCPKGHMTPRFAKNYGCSTCHKENSKKAPGYKVKRNRGVKKVLDKLRLEILEALNQSKCACCGEDELVFLCIDHVNGGGTRHRKVVKPGQRLYYWLRAQIKERGIRAVRWDFRVLCYNCNAAHWILGYCPHKPPKVKS